MWNNLIIGVVGSVIATIVVLLTRLAFYRILDLFPARALFKGITGTDAECLVFIPRLTDMAQKGQFLTPFPVYSVASPNQQTFQQRQLTPWVNSTSETLSVAHVLNILGRAGRVRNINLAFVDQDYDRWDSPMFIVGGSFKSTRVFETCKPIFSFRDNAFVLENTNETFQPNAADKDLGMLEKTINSVSGHPIWVAMGWRGAGTNAATYALVRWWKELGIFYGRKQFGLLIEMNDQDGWQQGKILRLFPQPHRLAKCLHPLAWNRLSKGMIQN